MDQQFECDKCHKIMKSSHTLRKHKCPTNLEDRIKCPACRSTFKSMSNLRNHKSIYHRPESNKKATCTSCNRTYKNRHTLRNHMCKPTDANDIESSPRLDDSSDVPHALIKIEENRQKDVLPLFATEQSTSVRDECKARMFGFMWRGLSNDRSNPYRMLDVYQIKKRFFRNLHSFFDFKMEAILDDKEQTLVSAILETDNLGESKDILNENLDIFVGILNKANAWLEC